MAKGELLSKWLRDKDSLLYFKLRVRCRLRYWSADGEAQAIKLVNEAANCYFIGNAQLLRRLQALEQSLTNNTKVIVPADSTLVNVIGGSAGIDINPPKK